MAQNEKQSKEIPGLKQLVSKELVGNAIIMVILVFGGWGLTFKLWGEAKGIGTYLGFIACMIPFFTVIQPYITVLNKRVGFLQGKWELKDDEIESPAEPLVNTWSLLLPRALIYGFGAMLLVLAGIKLSGWQPTPILTTVIVLIVNIITTTVLIKHYLPRDLLSYAAAVKNPIKQEVRPLAGYLMVEHAIPFIMLQGYINGCVANRAFHFEALKAAKSYVPSAALLQDAFIVFVLLALFQWMFSNAIARGDVHLGRIPADKLKNISWFKALGYIFCAGIIVVAAYGIILYIGKVPGLSVGMAILFKQSIIIFSVICGAWIGIRWGGSREYLKMQETA